MTSGPELSAEARYEFLKEISFGVRDTFDLDAILNHLLDAIRPIVQYDAAGIFVLSEDLLHTPYQTSAMKIAGIVRRGFDPLPPLSDPMQTQGKGVIGHVIATGNPVIVTDVRLNSHYVAGRLATQSEIAVPIKQDHRTIGALNLESDTPGAYHEKDIEVLEFLANAASLSIEKAILHAQVVEKKRIEEQLRVAREVQDRLLPQKSPCIEGYDIAALCLPTFEIGGDYFDYIALGKNELGVVIADVAGNGVPAALVMTAFRTLLLTRAPSERNPAELLNELNRRIPEFTRRRDFITAFYGILDTKGTCSHSRSKDRRQARAPLRH